MASIDFVLKFYTKLISVYFVRLTSSSSSTSMLLNYTKLEGSFVPGQELLSFSEFPSQLKRAAQRTLLFFSIDLFNKLTGIGSINRILAKFLQYAFHECHQTWQKNKKWSVRKIMRTKIRMVSHEELKSRLFPPEGHGWKSLASQSQKEFSKEFQWKIFSTI